MKTKTLIILGLSLFLFFKEINAASPLGGHTFFLSIDKLNDTINMYQNSSIALKVSAEQGTMSGDYLQNDFEIDGVFIYIKTDNDQVEIKEVINLTDNSLIQAKGKGIYMVSRLYNRAININGSRNLSVTFQYNCKTSDNNPFAGIKIYLIPSGDTVLRFNSAGKPTLLDLNETIGIDSTNTIVNYNSVQCPVDSLLTQPAATSADNSNNETAGQSIITAVSAQEKEIYCVYPNPTAGIFNIERETNQPISYELTDPVGNVMMKENNIEDQVFDIQSLKPGIYYINIINRDRSYRTKIVKN